MHKFSSKCIRFVFFFRIHTSFVRIFPLNIVLSLKSSETKSKKVFFENYTWISTEKVIRQKNLLGLGLIHLNMIICILQRETFVHHLILRNRLLILIKTTAR